jgi:hypothetical protein
MVEHLCVNKMTFLKCIEFSKYLCTFTYRYFLYHQTGWVINFFLVACEDEEEKEYGEEEDDDDLEEDDEDEEKNGSHLCNVLYKDVLLCLSLNHNSLIIAWPKSDDFELFQHIRKACPKDDTMRYESRVNNLDWEFVSYFCS